MKPRGARSAFMTRSWLVLMVPAIVSHTLLISRTVDAFTIPGPRPVVAFTSRGASAFLSSTTATTKPVSTSSSTPLLMVPEENQPAPTTFREAEVLGLKFMQEGNYEQALAAFKEGLQLPGSRSDVVRTKSLSGPSPVGGAMGGFESQNRQTLDEFELQAAHYNMACAHAQLGNLDESIAALQTAFQEGFDNYATVRGDPDLDPIKQEKGFEKLMEKYEPKKGFNPFGLFGGKS